MFKMENIPASLAMAVLFVATSIPQVMAKPEIRKMALAEAREMAVASPLPNYPYAARAAGMRGDGLFRIDVRRETGEVIRVEVVRSTGHKILDQETIKAFHHWRLRPHTDCDGLIIPVTFTY
jgi:TonB family protein